MSFKKLLGIISVVIVGMFTLMLTTSYAWYSFEKGSTTFSAVTNNDDIIVNYHTGEYINTNIAVPIASTDIDEYSEKNNFTINVKDNKENNDMLVTISLAEISIDGALQNANFKVVLYYQNSSVASVAGNTIGTGGATTKKLGSVTLDNDIDNNFELRVYILDNNGDQSSMMNKTFQAKIKIDVVSRLKTSITDWGESDIYVSSIMIDGKTSNSLPTSGYYTMSSSCTKGSSLSWEPLSKTITYNSGSYVQDNCSLTFTSDTNYPLLSSMESGSYVKYVGNNGCEGDACKGQNANYVDDNDMGYCYLSSSHKFKVNGWRIGYIKDDTAYLVSAGAPECIKTYVDRRTTSTSTTTLSTTYYYGSGYKFDSETGKFSLTGVTSSRLSWSSNYTSIINNTPYTCRSTSSTGTCNTLYEISSYYSSTQGYYYAHYNTDGAGVPNHIANLDNKALKYCNKDYAYGGVCDSNSVWAMDATDFEAIVGKELSSSSCYASSSNFSCGYNNDLIDNGSYYWFAFPYSSSSSSGVYWYPSYRYVHSYSPNTYAYGVRPVIRLESNVLVVGGSGDYNDPYLIQKGS